MTHGAPAPAIPAGLDGIKLMARATALFAFVGGVGQFAGAKSLADGTEGIQSIPVLGTCAPAVTAGDDHRGLGFHEQVMFAITIADLTAGILAYQVGTARAPASATAQGQVQTIAVQDGCGILGEREHGLGNQIAYK